MPAEEGYVQELTRELAAKLAAAFADVIAPLLVDRPLLTVRQAAVRLGVSERKMHEMLEAGEVGFVRVGDRRKVEPGELDAFIAARRTEATG